MSIVKYSQSVAPVTFQAAVGPARVEYSLAVAASASGAKSNKVSVPNGVTRQVMAETEAGANVVDCESLEDLFHQLDS